MITCRFHLTFHEIGPDNEKYLTNILLPHYSSHFINNDTGSYLHGQIIKNDILLKNKLLVISEVFILSSLNFEIYLSTIVSMLYFEDLFKRTDIIEFFF